MGHKGSFETSKSEISPSSWGGNGKKDEEGPKIFHRGSGCGRRFTSKEKGHGAGKGLPILR